MRIKAKASLTVQAMMDRHKTSSSGRSRLKLSSPASMSSSSLESSEPSLLAPGGGSSGLGSSSGGSSGLGSSSGGSFIQSFSHPSSSSLL